MRRLRARSLARSLGSGGEGREEAATEADAQVGGAGLRAVPAAGERVGRQRERSQPVFLLLLLLLLSHRPPHAGSVRGRGSQVGAAGKGAPRGQPRRAVSGVGAALTGSRESTETPAAGGEVLVPPADRPGLCPGVLARRRRWGLADPCAAGPTGERPVGSEERNGRWPAGRSGRWAAGVRGVL